MENSEIEEKIKNFEEKYYYATYSFKDMKFED